MDSYGTLAPTWCENHLKEGLFVRRRDLFTSLDIVFFDTTSIYFEGEGGESIGQMGNSKDNRPDLKQMVVGAVIDGQGRPICCELWPGNTADVATLVPVVERLRRRHPRYANNITNTTNGKNVVPQPKP